jgi:hypothetical protein
MENELVFIGIIIIAIVLFSIWYFFRPLGGCELSLCDCRCYPEGQTPEALKVSLCGVNCLANYNVSGCVLENGECKAVKAGDADISNSQTYCEKDEDCMPAQCCHPNSCVNKLSVNCTGILCTEECRAGTMDCGCGSCICKNNRCVVSWINETWC